jgi:hypothetical protein
MAKAQVKKKGAKAPKKTAVKKRVTTKKATAKKTARKKRTATKKKTTGNKRVAVKRVIKTPVTKKATPKKSATNTRKKQKTARVVKLVPDTDLSPVEEQSPVIHAVTGSLPDMTEKDRQRDANRNYDNHNIRLSSTKKGGPKPSGKKPLW